MAFHRSRSSSKTAKKSTNTPRRAPAPGEQSVVVESLGSQGDGLSQISGKPLFIPYGLPGETVRVDIGPEDKDGYSGRLLHVETASPIRVEAPCPLFMSCGGCNLQHAELPYVLQWKRQHIIHALSHRGYDGAVLDQIVHPTRAVPTASRRRASFAFDHQGKGRFVLGFHRANSHDLLPVSACPLLHPELVAALPALNDALPNVIPFSTRGHILVTVLNTVEDGGTCLDVVVDSDQASRWAETLSQRHAWAEFAERADLGRVSLKSGEIIEPLVVRKTPALMFGEAAVLVPPGVFLQPSRNGEEILQELVLSSLPPAKKKQKVADLFCGIGTFSLPLAQAGYRVDGYDSAAAAISSLTSARHSYISAKNRDLFRLPLMEHELDPYAALVLDPPRAGARAQCEMIALSKNYAKSLETIIMVSCQPATFARDARVLENAGFALRSVTPVDQFCWSAHVELVASFSRT